LSAEHLPDLLSRLIGHHPASLRTIRCDGGVLAAHDFAHLEIETKHGHVVLIDHVTGQAYANPPALPGAGDARHCRDLTDYLPGAFDGRPTIKTITPLMKDSRLTGFHVGLSTGAGFSFTLDEETPLILSDDH